MPSGAAHWQGAHYPAGTWGDIQAVTCLSHGPTQYLDAAGGRTPHGPPQAPGPVDRLGSAPANLYSTNHIQGGRRRRSHSGRCLPWRQHLWQDSESEPDSQCRGRAAAWACQCQSLPGCLAKFESAEQIQVQVAKFSTGMNSDNDFAAGCSALAQAAAGASPTRSQGRRAPARGGPRSGVTASATGR